MIKNVQMIVRYSQGLSFLIKQQFILFVIL